LEATVGERYYLCTDGDNFWMFRRHAKSGKMTKLIFYYYRQWNDSRADYLHFIADKCIRVEGIPGTYVIDEMTEKVAQAIDKMADTVPAE
jgi:hypothetical protein